MSGADEDDDKLAPTPEELARAEARRDALDDGVDPLAELLVASVRPKDLDATLHEKILAGVLGDGGSDDGDASVEDEEPAATPLELQRAEALRRALETGDPDGPMGALVALVVALRSAYRPQPLDELAGERILRPALRLGSRRVQRVTVVVAVSAAVAIAAGLFGVFLRQPPPPADGGSASAVMVPGMVEARSTGELFGREDFPATGGTTDRIDRIQSSREADLRNNRFVAWGVP